MPAASGRVAFTDINICTIAGGKFTSSHVNWDILGLVRQSGAAAPRLEIPSKEAGVGLAGARVR